MKLRACLRAPVFWRFRSDDEQPKKGRSTYLGAAWRRRIQICGRRASRRACWPGTCSSPQGRGQEPPSLTSGRTCRWRPCQRADHTSLVSSGRLYGPGGSRRRWPQTHGRQTARSRAGRRTVKQSFGYPVGAVLVLAASILWGTTGTAATFAPDVSPIAIGATAMGFGGLLQALIALRSIRHNGRGL